MIRLLLADESCARNQQVGISEQTPLQLAAELGNTSTVEIFLEDPTVDRNIISGWDMTALDYAIKNGHFDIVLLNDPYVAKDRIDEDGRTILHKSARRKYYYELYRANRFRILEAILRVGGIDVNHQDHKGKTALHYASELGNARTVEILLEDPTVDRNIVDTSDMTALDHAINNDHFDTAVVLLNDHDVVKDRIDEKGMTILHKIVRRKDYYELYRANKLRILDAILSVGGLDVNHQDDEGKTALHYAAELRDPEMILRLTAAGADSAIEDESGYNAVYYAEQIGLAPIYLEALNAVFGLSLVGLK